MTVEGRIRAAAYRRSRTSSGGVADNKLGEFDCLSAKGVTRLNRIGNGEAKVLAEDIKPVNVKTGDVIVAWQESATYTKLPGVLPVMRLCCFVVRNITYDGGHIMTLSGDDMLSELLDYPALTPIGESQNYYNTITIGNPGKRTFLLRAAYLTGVDEIRLHNASTDRVFEKDLIYIALQNGETFITRIKEITTDDDTPAGTVDIRLVAPLPSVSKEVGPGGVYVVLYTDRITVAEDWSSIFDIGTRISMVTIDRGPGGLYYRHETRIDAFETEDLEDESTAYIIRMETAPLAPVPSDSPIDTGQPNEIVATAYDVPTTADVTNLFYHDTGDQWSVAIRDKGCDIGTTYEPGGESVWDVLQALMETTGYAVKLIKNFADPTKPDKRQIRILNPAGAQLVRGTLLEVAARQGTTKQAANYAEILGEPKVDIEGEPVTHVIPFGAGGGVGRFSVADADLSILDQYTARYPLWRFRVGRRGAYWSVYREYKQPAGRPLMREVWRTVTFSQIRPINEGDAVNVRGAANQLLTAACEYLLESIEENLSVEVDVHTWADPQPGDAIPRIYSNISPHVSIDRTDMLIAEVEHSADSNLRMTRLLLTRNRAAPMTGMEQVAKELVRLNRNNAQTNAPTAGGVRFYDDRMVFRGAGTVGASTGSMSIASQTADVAIDAPNGNAFVRANSLTVNGRAIMTGRTSFRNGMEMDEISADEGNPLLRWQIDLIRAPSGRPFFVATSYSYGGQQPELAEDPALDDSLYDGGLY